MPFQKYGFLGQQARENIANIRKQNHSLFELIDEVNEYTHKAIASPDKKVESSKWVGKRRLPLQRVTVSDVSG
jgi:hypothetical protein